MWLSVIEGLLNCSMQPTIAVYAADICPSTFLTSTTPFPQVRHRGTLKACLTCDTTYLITPQFIYLW